MNNHHDDIDNVLYYKRGRAWRCYQKYLHNGEGMGSNKISKPEKNWKLMYFRSAKLARAKQLGFEYPRKNKRQQLHNLLNK